MSIFSALQSLWSLSCIDTSASFDASSTCASTGPLVNIDGTPMLNDAVDIHGHPYGVVDTFMQDIHTGLDTVWLDCSSDCGCDFGSSSGMYFSEW